MTKGPIKNMAASVRQRLTNTAKAANRGADHPINSRKESRHWL